MSRVPESVTVLQAQEQGDGRQEPFSPPPIEEVVEAIRREEPALVFAPHVETSSGIILPEEYIRQMAQAVHAVGGLLVIDCIASGCVWLDMADLGIDVLITEDGPLIGEVNTNPVHTLYQRAADKGLLHPAFKARFDETEALMRRRG